MKCEVTTLTFDLLHQMGELDDLQNGLRMCGPGFCLLADGKPVAAGGIVEFWKGSGKGWTIIPEDVLASKFLMRRVHQAVKRLLPVVRDGLQLQRLESETPVGTRGCRWLENFGFKHEGDMPQYRNGETFARFAWVTDSTTKVDIR